MSKPVESIVVPESQMEVWCETEQRFVINAPSNFYIISAMGDRIFYKTRDRAAAQRQANLDWDGKYQIRTISDKKTSSRLESGGFSVVATATRARPSSRPPK